MGVAVLGIVVLLGGLVLFESFSAADDEEEDALPRQAFSQPVVEGAANGVKELPPEQRETADGEPKPPAFDTPKTEEAKPESAKGAEQEA